MRWGVGFGLTAMVAIGLVLLFLLTEATSNRDLYERNYTLLFAINVVVASLLLIAIGWIAYRLIKRLRQKKFGSRLLLKLAAVFALAGFMPGVLIYVVSYQFVSRSIESWFDVKVEGALDAGLNLGRTTLEALSADLVGKTRLAAAQLADRADVSIALPLERARDAMGAEELQLWGASGRLIAAAGQSRYLLTPDTPSPQQFRTARGQRVISWVEGLEESVAGQPALARIKVLALLNSIGVGSLGEARYLLATKQLPASLVDNALAVTQANREYQERALARDGLRRMYIGTLTLSLFLAVFGGVLLAVVLGNQIVRPLLVLADGVREVAAGDLSPKASLRGRDELDGLTRSFADMTQQLFDARQAVQVSMSQTNAARANLQTILDNLTTGVMVLEADGTVISSNPGATRILKLPMTACEGQRLAEITGLTAFGEGVQQQFDAFLAPDRERSLDHWQQSFELGNASLDGIGRPSNNTLTLIARGAELPGNQYLLVFDDISEIVSAQRAQAWGEVARRLAHEIKNPLTPIQLSAERLEMKLTGKLAAQEQALLTKSVKTIVDQVDAMKRLVNEFRDYARLPAAELKAVDLNALAQDVLALYAHEHTEVPILAELDPVCPQIQGDPQQLRQVLHNLLQNAQDATVSAGRADPDRAVVLKTQWLASSQRVRLTVQDNGTGFPDHILKRAFEPYVTTKDKGTGLGLAVVKKIADEHGTRVDISNRQLDGQSVGAQVSLSFGIERAPEQRSV
ncbi:sensor histidine kinase [Rhodoferax antarcticus]|nr:ATP-binding protein [Rhodoferax antarcticus]APW48171.1 PAS domain-containing sensor histidine kinase [Rhodoferax antarcticus]MCW2314305.1 nitrogen fixation/metabolism regulation signal transduction histidine kinase [Rhodoferax antarcticus]